MTTSSVSLIQNLPPVCLFRYASRPACVCTVFVLRRKINQHSLLQVLQIFAAAKDQQFYLNRLFFSPSVMQTFRWIERRRSQNSRKSTRCGYLQEKVRGIVRLSVSFYVQTFFVVQCLLWDCVFVVFTAGPVSPHQPELQQAFYQHSELHMAPITVLQVLIQLRNIKGGNSVEREK